MIQLGTLAAQAAGPIVKKAAEKAVLTYVAELAKKAVDYTMKPKAVPKAETAKSAVDKLVNDIMQDTEKLAFKCATEFAVGSIRNYLAEQAKQNERAKAS